MSAGLGKSAVLVTWYGLKHGSLQAVHSVCMGMVCTLACCQPRTQALSPPSQTTHHRPSLHQNPGGHSQIHCQSRGMACPSLGLSCARVHRDTRTHTTTSTAVRTELNQHAQLEVRVMYQNTQVHCPESCW